MKNFGLAMLLITATIDLIVLIDRFAGTPEMHGIAVPVVALYGAWLVIMISSSALAIRDLGTVAGAWRQMHNPIIVATARIPEQARWGGFIFSGGTLLLFLAAGYQLIATLLLAAEILSILHRRAVRRRLA